MRQKHLLQALCLAVSLMFVAISCAPKEEAPEAPTLSLSTTALTIGNGGGDAPTITVTTNQTKINVAETADWLAATISGKDVKITALPNTTQQDRKGNVLVFAGGLTEKITVTQSAAEVVLDLNVNPEKIVAPAQGRQVLVDVRATTGNWEITKDEDMNWIEIQKFSNFIQLTILPNETGAERTGKLFAKLGTIIKEIEVAQAAKVSKKYGMPLLSLLKLDKFKLVKYEQDNGNIFFSYSQGGSLWGMTFPTEVVFVYDSEVFDQVSYAFAYKTDAFESAIATVKADKREEIKHEKYFPSLEKLGFKLKGTAGADGSFTAEKEGENIRVEVKIPKDEKVLATVTFTKFFIQDKDYPTFAELPDFAKYCREGAKYADVKAAEEANGFVLWVEHKVDKRNPKHAEEIHATIYRDKREKVEEQEETTAEDLPELMATMEFYDWGTNTPEDKLGVVNEYQQIRRDYTKVYWKLPTGKFEMTKEFQKLLKDSGFEFVQATDNNGGAVYMKKVDDNGANRYYYLFFSVATYSDINVGNPSLSIAAAYTEKELGSSTSSKRLGTKNVTKLADTTPAILK